MSAVTTITPANIAVPRCGLATLAQQEDDFNPPEAARSP